MAPGNGRTVKLLALLLAFALTAFALWQALRFFTEGIALVDVGTAMLLGLIADWGGTGAINSGIGTPYSLLTPTYYFGKGFGDLPDDAGWLRAFAVTGQVGYQFPTTSYEVAQNLYIPQNLVYGFSLQYSMPYLKSEIQDYQLPDFINHLIPIVEAQFSTPVANNYGNSSATIGTINPGSTQNLAAELFTSTAGIKAAIVPFRTSPDMAGAVMRGDVDVAFEFYAALSGLLADNKIVALASTGLKRTAYLPNVPTVMEGGIKDYDVASWNGLSVPAGTPRPIIATLNAAMKEVVPTPDVQRKSSQMGMAMRWSTPEDMTARMKADIAKWGAVIEKAGIPKRD